MPRGRPKKLKEKVSINGEDISIAEFSKTPVAKDEREEKIAFLESKLKDFESRMSSRTEDIVPSKEPIVAKQKPEHVPQTIIKELTTRDMWEIEDRKPVTGVFRMQNKKPGERGMVRIGALRKYKEDKMDPWIFEHNKTYTLPKWIADWINGGDTPETDKVKSPRCNVVAHNDQWNDLQNKRPLSNPKLNSMYSFTPVASW